MPKKRKLKYRRADRIRGAQCCARAGAIAGIALWAWDATLGLPKHGTIQRLRRWLCTDKRPIEEALRQRRMTDACMCMARTPPGALAIAAGAVGCCFLPVSKYWSETSSKGMRYEGTTATNQKPRTPRPSLLSTDTILKHPWTVPIRLLLFQWAGVDGTIAADTSHFAFGTRMHVPGYGWGVVEDRGGAIQGVEKVDLFHRNHKSAIQWGRQRLTVEVER